MLTSDSFKIRKSIKKHICLVCNSIILEKTNYAIKIWKKEENCNIEYITEKYHMNCGLTNDMLTFVEKEEIRQKLEEKEEFKTENELQTKISQFLHKQKTANKLYFIKNHAGLWRPINSEKWFSMCPVGITDYIIFLKNSQTLFVEIKLPNKELEKHQEIFADLIKSYGFSHYKITSLKELYDILRKHDYRFSNDIYIKKV